MAAYNFPDGFPDEETTPGNNTGSGAEANDPLYNTTGIPPHTMEKNGLPKPARPVKLNDIEDALDDEEDDRDRFPKNTSDV